MSRPTPRLLDARRAADLAAALLHRRPGYLETWAPAPGSPGHALVNIDARFLETLVDRLNRAPEKNKLAFLELLGIELIAAQVARTPLVFSLADGAADTRVPGGARVAAPPPEGSPAPVVFETEETLGLMAAPLTTVVSLWPGRDEWIDHSAAHAAGQSLTLFRRRELKPTPHHLYLAHDTLFALAGDSRVDLEFELTQGGSESLDIVWEYWDGKVWRGFRRQLPECESVDEPAADATNGLRQSGRLRLETDCAETGTTTVHDIEAYWIRGRLDEPLPPDPAQLLPEITEIRASTVIDQPLDVQLVRVEERYENAASDRVTCELLDGDGRPIADALVELAESGAVVITGATGEAEFALADGEGVYSLEISLFDAVFERGFRYDPPEANDRHLHLTLSLLLGGLQPDAAFADAESQDLTRPFYPFGQQPKPGSTFFVQVDEAFSKPGAQVALHVRATETPQDRFDVTSSSTTPVPLEHSITWQYWDGRKWSPLLSRSGSEPDPALLTASGAIEFPVPEDFAIREVEGKKGYWLRARLASGAFGFSHEVTWQDSGGTDNAFTYVIHQPPALSDLRVSYTWTHGPFAAEHVLAYNDFAFTDRTGDATWPGSSFQPFQYVHDNLPAVYLGFSGAFPVDRLGLYAGVVEDPEVDFVPPLAWEFFDGSLWQPLPVRDETGDLRYPGIVSFTGPRDARAAPRFGSERHWLRARQKEDGPPASPTVARLNPNAVWASQWETTQNENAGTSNGQPRQQLTLRSTPVLPGERIQVRELAGARAEVEWRSLAAAALAAKPGALERLEGLLAREGRDLDVEAGAVRLRRDPRKRVNEVWITWESRPHLRASGPEDRHYVIDRGRGRVRFGDGRRGRIPPLGADVLAVEYRAGGGSTGNVREGMVNQPLTGIPGLESVSNPRNAEGGADEETLDLVSRRGPLSLRHRGRALLPADLEVMAREASSAVAVARAHPATDPQGRPRPGWVTLTIIPDTAEPRPWPSFGLRQKVARYLESRADAALAAGGRIRVAGPEYRPVDADLGIAPRDLREAGAAVDAARLALETFLHPLRGGPDGKGWPPGRALQASELCAALERVPELDHVQHLELRIDGTLMGDTVAVATRAVIAPGELSVRVASEGN